MLSTRASDYALRGMVYLARQPAGKLSMASEIATAEDMPEYFFSKIFQSLAKSGLVNSFRGSNGGFVLARSPEEIRVLDVIEAIDGPISTSKCATSPDVRSTFTGKKPRNPSCPCSASIVSPMPPATSKPSRKRSEHRWTCVTLPHPLRFADSARASARRFLQHRAFAFPVAECNIQRSL